MAMSDTDTGAPQPQQEPSPAAEKPSRPTIADAVADFVQMFVDYVRQETGDVVKEKIVRPTQKAGQVVAFALAAAAVLALGIGYLSVAALMVLAQFAGWPGALAIVGALLVMGAGGLTYAKTRSIQK